MIELRLRKIGNSLGVVLPKEALARLDMVEGEALYLTEAPDGGYRLQAHDPDFAHKMAAAESLMRRYRDTLHTLAQ